MSRLQPVVFAKWFSTTRAKRRLATATAAHDLTLGSLPETIVTSISVFSRVRILPLIRFAVLSKRSQFRYLAGCICRFLNYSAFLHWHC